ncbi:MAG: hypothetical protein KC613_21645, partial [Myxococcales bacterium]|nr:hypothetical protein [Myxococcales bacterium]
MPRPTRMLQDPWSQPDAIQRPAIDFHLEQLAAWLLRAGAEPRLTLVLCAGKGARARFFEGLSAYGVRVVHTPSTDERPLPAEILGHQGDHYNDRLFFMDGFADRDPARQFETLDGQRSVLAKQATWVAVVVENLRALERLATFAPNLFKAFHRRTLVLAAGAPDEPRPNDQLVERWRQDGRVAELAFVEALSASRPAESYDDFGRLVRAGFAGNLVGGQSLHPERAGLLALWRGRVPGPEAAGPLFAAGLARHGVLTEEALAALRDDPLSWVAADRAAGLDETHRALAELVHRPSPKAIAAASALAASAGL